jgi:dynein heavy chain
MKDNFTREWGQVVTVEPLLYGSFIPMLSEGEGKPVLHEIYCELTNRDLLLSNIDEALMFYNQTHPVKMNLVMFMNAIEHTVRIVRIIQFSYGNALLVGVGGSGRKSLTLLASSIAMYDVF